MAKYEIALVQTKAIVVEAEADDADTAVAKAKQALGNPETHFSKRIGSVHVAAVREVKSDA